MDDTTVAVVITGASALAVIALVYILNKKGLIKRFTSGEFWNASQDKMHDNSVSY